MIRRRGTLIRESTPTYRYAYKRGDILMLEHDVAVIVTRYDGRKIRWKRLKPVSQ